MLLSKFKALCDLSEQFIFELDSSFCIQTASSRALQILQKNEPEILGLSIIELLAPYETDLTLLLAEASAQDVSSASSVLALPTGKMFIDWRLGKFTHESAQMGYLLVGKNRTEELEIRKREKDLTLNFNNILHHLPGFVYWKNKESRYLGCNENFAKVAGLRRLEDIVGKTDYDLAWGKTEAELFREGDRAVMAGSPIYNREEPQVQADGKKATVLATKVPLKDENENVIGVLGIYQDITELKMTEIALRKAKEAAEAANQAKTEFMENMSHDFKTPLNGIYGVTQVLQARSDLSENVKELLSAQEKSILRLKNFIEVILDFDRLYGGKIQIHSEPIDLREMIESVIQNLAHQARHTPVDLVIDYPSKVPRQLISDSLCITRIFLNVIGNAVKFTEKGHVIVSVKVLTEKKDNITLQIDVEDTGPGIPANQLEDIFERFHRLERSNKGLKAGHGLGLAIVKELVEKLKGEITVASSLNVGTTFSIKMPFKLQDTSHLVAKYFEEQQNVRFLIVDDKKYIANAISKQFNVGTIDKCDAKNAVNLLVSAAQNGKPYHILFVDDETHIDALQLMSIISSLSSIPKVMSILLTRSQDIDYFNNATKAGYFDFMIKPILPSEFSRKLAEDWKKWQAD